MPKSTATDTATSRSSRAATLEIRQAKAGGATVLRSTGVGFEAFRPVVPAAADNDVELVCGAPWPYTPMTRPAAVRRSQKERCA